MDKEIAFAWVDFIRSARYIVSQEHQTYYEAEKDKLTFIDKMHVKWKNADESIPLELDPALDANASIDMLGFPELSADFADFPETNESFCKAFIEALRKMSDFRIPDDAILFTGRRYITNRYDSGKRLFLISPSAIEDATITRTFNPDELFEDLFYPEDQQLRVFRYTAKLTMALDRERKAFRNVKKIEFEDSESWEYRPLEKIKSILPLNVQLKLELTT